MSTSGPVTCSKFSPNNTYHASGQIALDNHQIKVQTLTSSQTSLNTSFNLDKSCKVTNLKWIQYLHQDVIALTLTKGSILLYSPLENQIISELSTPQHLPVQDFHYCKYTSTSWSCDNGGNVHEWNSDYKLVHTFNIKDFVESNENLMRISSVVYQDQPYLLLGSHSIYLYDITNKTIVKTYPGHIQPVNVIQTIDDMFLTSSTNDRFINLYTMDKVSTKGVFVANSSVKELATSQIGDRSILVIINEVGDLEVFNNFLTEEEKEVQSKKKRKQVVVKSRSSTCKISVSRPKEEIKSPLDSNLIINSITIDGKNIIISWLENGNVPVFETIPWLEENGEFAITSDTTFYKSKLNINVVDHSLYGHDVAAKKLYNEGNVIISDGSNLKDLEFEDDESLAEKLDRLSTSQPKKSNKKISSSKTGTLTIILSQSLKNNDHTLLETVLSNRDPQIIQNTLSKLDSSLAVILLDRLSERIQRQTSRFDQLNFWLKWIIIIHGAVLASLPNVSIKLSNLHSVLTKKGKTLPRLLELQGRLNMLYQQNELKREILTQDVKQDDEVESDVEYIEEIDDAEVLGLVEEDDFGFEGTDDYIDSDQDGEIEEDDEDEEEEGLKSVLDLEDDGNYSDLEADK